MIWRHERAIFVDFKKIILRRSQNSISTVKKSFFQTLMRIHFWVVGCFLLILWTRCAFEKCLLESKETFDIIQTITWNVEMISRRQRAIFVDFKKMILRRGENQISTVKKSFFQTLTRLCFWLVDCFLFIFWTRCVYKKCLLESKQTFDIS